MAQWENVGKIKGDKGDRGERGLQGPKGDKGDKGDPATFSDPTWTNLPLESYATSYIQPQVALVDGGTSVIFRGAFKVDGRETTKNVVVAKIPSGFIPKEWYRVMGTTTDGYCTIAFEGTNIRLQTEVGSDTNIYLDGIKLYMK